MHSAQHYRSHSIMYAGTGWQESMHALLAQAAATSKATETFLAKRQASVSFANPLQPQTVASASQSQHPAEPQHDNPAIVRRDSELYQQSSTNLQLPHSAVSSSPNLNTPFVTPSQITPLISSHPSNQLQPVELLRQRVKELNVTQLSGLTQEQVPAPVHHFLKFEVITFFHLSAS